MPSLGVLLTFYLFFCQHHPGVADETVAYVKKAYKWMTLLE